MRPAARRARAAVLLAAVLGSAPAVAGQEAPGADLTVSLVTVGPGSAVWERFGHNLLWVQDQRAALDSVWDWGRFSFNTEGFLIKFAQADMRYWMAGDPGTPVVNWYGSGGRTVVRQELALTPGQRVALLAFLREQDTDANRYYQYHYYLDNCSTRIRNALDAVLGGAIRARTDTVLTPWSYRDHTKRLNQHNLAIYVGLTTLLAGTVDRPITAWEEMFLPSGLQRWLREVRVPGAGGVLVPLVVEEATIAPGGRYEVPAAPSTWWPRFLLAGIVVGAGLALSGRTARPWLRRCFLPLAWAYLALAGVSGLLMMLLWSLSGHEVAWRNENLWQFNLAALALVGLLGRARRGEGRARAAARLLVIVVATGSLLGVALKLFPAFDQANWDVIALALPANLGLAAGLLGTGSRKA